VASGEIIGRTDAAGRRYRWLFTALHDFDIGALQAHRPFWDMVICLASLLGLVISVSGLVSGWRRLARKWPGFLGFHRRGKGRYAP
jgi:uncharacterized iron-regulated membrane protein